ncbi:aspartate--tRNA(Asn) ligase [Candidatus Pacearchaeota archaeon]|nr:aspartate--tRNA(Asn) ligase [Candidatus Pacearchaeota archaeon]
MKKDTENERILIGNISEGEVTVAGWLYDSRDLGKVRFVVLRDVSGEIQITAHKDKTNKDIFEAMGKTPRESVVIIKGLVKKSDKAPGGKEIVPESFLVLTEAEQPLPIDVSDFSKTELPKRLDYRFLDTRRKKTSAIFKIRSSIYRSIVDFFDKENFIIINTPKLTTIGLESGAESFALDHFGKKVVLAQSPQFYKQMFTVGGFERVMEIGQVYRAEKSHTTRHLTEFTGVDFEMGFINDENDVMDVIEKMLKYMISEVKERRKSELALLNVELKVPAKIPRISMDELKRMLAKQGKKLGEDEDLDAEAERMIGEYVLKEFKEEFVFVTDYPAKVRPFYHMRPEKNPKGTRSFDLLWRGVEIATGAQREHRLKILQKQAKEKGVKIPQIYEDIFRYGAIPHGGVGFGLDRITQRMLNLDNIREALLLPRDPERVTP